MSCCSCGSPLLGASVGLIRWEPAELSLHMLSSLLTRLIFTDRLVLFPSVLTWLKHSLHWGMCRTLKFTL